MDRIIKIIFMLLFAAGLFVCTTCTNNLTISLTEIVQTYDTENPVPGNSGTITIGAGDIRAGGITLSWAQAVDNTVNHDSLEYKIVYSPADNISTLAEAQTNGIVAVDWTAGITSGDITGLSRLTLYYINVLVRDKAGNKAAYAAASVTTLDDSVLPVVGNSGTIAVDSTGMETFTISWTKGTDDMSPYTTLKYWVYYSTSDNISTAAAAALNGTLGSDAGGETDISTKVVINLIDDITYYVNVVVEDEAGNSVAYSRAATTTLKHSRIYFVNGDLIQRAELDGTGVQTIASGLNDPYALALDIETREVYWTETTGSPIKIRKCGFDGSNIQDVITSGLTTPMGIAIDYEQRLLFWTDYSNDVVFKASLPVSSTAAADHIFATNALNSVDSPIGIDIDMVNQNVFWIEDRATKTVRVSTTSTATISNYTYGTLLGPYDLAVYPNSSTIFFADITNSYHIYSTNYSLSSSANLINTVIQMPLGIDVDKINNKIYWTDSAELKIFSALLTGEPKTQLPIPGLTYPAGIAVY